MGGLIEFLQNYEPDDNKGPAEDLTENEFIQIIEACFSAPEVELTQCQCGLIHNHRPDVDRYVCPRCGVICLIQTE